MRNLYIAVLINIFLITTQSQKKEYNLIITMNCFNNFVTLFKSYLSLQIDTASEYQNQKNQLKEHH